MRQIGFRVAAPETPFGSFDRAVLGDDGGLNGLALQPAVSDAGI